MSDIYKSTPPFSAKEEIRVLLLEPGSSLSPLRASLKRTSLICGHRYEAVSYVWQQLPGHDTLRVGDSWISITTNLALALKSLRYPSQVRTLWVDAICIDQDCPEERSQQVLLMGDIYSKAIRVLAWLGPETAKTAQAFQIIKSLSSGLHLSALPWLQTLGQTPTELQQISLVEAIAPLGELLNRPYWSRLWVVQEIVRSATTVLICGSQTLDWSTCARARRCWLQHSEGCCFGIVTLIEPLCRRVLNSMAFTWERYSAGPHATWDGVRRSGVHKCEEASLLTRLNLARNLQAQDARDKIYGTLGLVTPKERHLTPDYEISVECVYTTWAFKIIQSSDLLELLLHAKYDNRLPGLPSWVPDWSQRFLSREVVPGFASELLKRRVAVAKCYNADGWLYVSTTHSLEMKDTRYLRLSGRSVDGVESAAHALIPPDGGYLTNGHELIRTIKGWCDTLSSWESLAGVTNNMDMELDLENAELESYWDLFTGTHHLYPDRGRFTTELSIGGYLVWRQWLQGFAKEPDADVKYVDKAITDLYYAERKASPSFDAFHWAIIDLNYERRLFKTKSGLVGLGPEELSTGDRVYLLQGSSVPVLLRQSDAKVEGIAEVYELIGCAVVDGIMFGEASLGERTGWQDVWLC